MIITPTIKGAFILTLQDESRLSFYKKIARISTHQNISLVQHTENLRIFVRKDLSVYEKDIYLDLKKHPCRFFPRIYECVEADETLILIEEYIHGSSLKNYLKEKGTLGEEEVKSLMLDICEALKPLHNRPEPIIHRDLKPSNILLTENHQIRIIDFNIARIYNKDSSPEHDTTIMGTRKYAAPEQYGYAQTDVRTDIYALGVLMNYLLTSKYPSEEIFSGSLSPVIKKCILFDPDKRYQSVSDLQNDLRGTYAPETSDSNACKSHWDKPFLPPGFRTGVRWKILLSAVVYALMWYLGLTTEFESGSGLPLTDALLYLNRIAFLCMGMCLVFFWFNYMDIHQFLPLMKKKGRRIIGYILYTVLIIIAIMSILSMFETRF